MGNVLGKLPFQNILFLARGLYSLVHLDDTLGNLAQLIIGESRQVFYLKTLIMVGFIGEDAQLGHILSQAMHKPIKHNGKEYDSKDGKPDVMLVGLQRLGEIVVIRQSASDNNGIGRKISGHIEVIMLQGFRLSLHTRAQSCPQCFLYLLSVDVIGEMIEVVSHIVVHHLAIRAYQSNTQVLTLVFSYKSIQLVACHIYCLSAAVAQNDSLIVSQRQIFL